VASAAMFTDLLAYGLVIPVLPDLALRTGSSPGALGLLFASYALTLVAVTPAVGLWVDRSGPRTPFLVGLIGLAGATLLFSVSQTFTALMCARVFQGAAGAVSWTAGLALVAAVHEPRTRGRAMGTALAAANVGMLLGPPAGGLLFEHIGPRAPFLLAAAMAVVDAAARWAWVSDPPRSTLEPRGRSLWRDRRVAGLVSLTALGAALVSFVEPILPLHWETVFGVGPGAVGLTFGAALLAAAASYPVMGRLADRTAPGPVAGFGAFLAAAAFVGLSFSPDIWTSGLCLVLAAVGTSAILGPISAAVGDLAESVSPPAYGSAYALYNTAYAAGLSLGPLLGGLGYGALGFRRTVLAFSAVACVAGAVTLFLRSRRGAAPAASRASSGRGRA